MPFDYPITPVTSGIIPAISSSQTHFGSPSGDSLCAFSCNRFDILSDVITAPDGNPNVFGMLVNHNAGGAGCKGYRIGFAAILSIALPPDSMSYNPYYTGAYHFAETSVNVGGTGGTSKGSIYGSNPQVALLPGATYWARAVGAEVDVGVLSGASVRTKIGVNITTIGSDAVAGSVTDAALAIGSVNGASPKWSVGILLTNGNGAAPINATGTVVKSDVAFSCAAGVDFSNLTFSGHAFQSNGFSVSGAGKIAGDMSGFKIMADGSVKPV